MSASCCTPSDLHSARRRRVLWAVLGINAVMFMVEMVAGLLAGSVALQADSLDMLGDTLVYGFSLLVVAGSLEARVRAAQLKGVIMLLFGLGVLAQVAWKIATGVVPQPVIVSSVALLALGANLVCLALLVRHRTDDINMRSTWVCSRNDIIANTGVLVSAAAVALFGSIWPDVIVSLLIVVLFLASARGVLVEAAATLSSRAELQPLCPERICPANACRCITA